MPKQSPEPEARLAIGGVAVGHGHPTFLIAEIGVNHDGDAETAMRLVEAAWEAGADAVKVQLFRAATLVHPTARLAAYQRATGAASPRELLSRLELDDRTVGRVVAATREAGMIPLATPFSPADVTRVADLKLPAVKIASPDLVNVLLLDAAADLRVPILLSTGAAHGHEIDATVRRLHGRDVALLHCVSSYPTPDDDARIGHVRVLAARYGTVVGYSDHTQNPAAGALAVAAGAFIVEKHLTHCRSARGPDHAASFDPRQFADYAARIRAADALVAASPGPRTPAAGEADVRSQSRQSLVAARPIAAGEVVTRDALTCQRPGTGIPTSRLDDVLGLVAARDIPPFAMLDWSDLDTHQSQAA